MKYNVLSKNNNKAKCPSGMPGMGEYICLSLKGESNMICAQIFQVSLWCM